MKKTIIAGVVAALALCLPGIASAHSGSVTCGKGGVIFTYNADFPTDTVVTEDVNGVTKQVTVKANTALTDIIPATSDHVLARATWVGGGTIAPTDLTCTDWTPPYCIPTETVTNTVYIPGPETVQYVYVPVDGPIKTLTVTKFVVKYKTRWRVVVRLVKYKPVKQPKRSLPGGTLG